MLTRTWFVVTAISAELVQLGLGQSVPGTVTVVSAASYAAAVAPDSLASIFGQGLSAQMAIAEIDAHGQLPTTLDGTRVTVNGHLAPLVFVSPLQINCLIPAGTELGDAAVVVTSTRTASTAEGKVMVLETAPGIFSLGGSGKGAGALLNAQTFQGGPFRVETLENPGLDKRTRLAIYATGLRHAGSMPKIVRRSASDAPSAAIRSRLHAVTRRFAAAVLTRETEPRAANIARYVTALASTSIGSSPLTVEYAGPAPGFFGLDQVNVVLGRELDGAGSVELQVTASGRASNKVSAVLDRLPPLENCGLTPQPCADLRGKWLVAETMVEACTFSALGESETDTERHSGEGQVEIEDEGGCAFGYQPVVAPELIVGIDPKAIRRKAIVSGNHAQVTGQAVVLLPDAGVSFTQNSFEGKGMVCGNRILLDGVGRFAFSIVSQGVTVNVQCTLTSTAQMNRSF